MDIKEALEHLEDGHAIWSVDSAQEICKALGVSYSKTLERTYHNEGHPMGVTLFEGSEARGVDSVSLGRHIAKVLGVDGNAHQYLGTGRQGREYARVVGEALGQKEASA